MINFATWVWPEERNIADELSVLSKDRPYDNLLTDVRRSQDWHQPTLLIVSFTLQRRLKKVQFLLG